MRSNCQLSIHNEQSTLHASQGLEKLPRCFVQQFAFNTSPPSNSVSCHLPIHTAQKATEARQPQQNKHDHCCDVAKSKIPASPHALAKAKANTCKQPKRPQSGSTAPRSKRCLAIETASSSCGESQASRDQTVQQTASSNPQLTCH